MPTSPSPWTPSSVSTTTSIMLSPRSGTVRTSTSVIFIGSVQPRRPSSWAPPPGAGSNPSRLLRSPVRDDVPVSAATMQRCAPALENAPVRAGWAERHNGHGAVRWTGPAGPGRWDIVPRARRSCGSPVAQAGRIFVAPRLVGLVADDLTGAADAAAQFAAEGWSAYVLCSPGARPEIADDD